MPISRSCPRCGSEVSVAVSLIPWPAPYTIHCPRCEEAIPTALAERAAWVRVQLWKLFFVLISISGFRHYGLKKLGSALLVMILAGGLFGFLASLLLGWLTQIGIDFFYFGVLGREDREALAPDGDEPPTLPPPGSSTPSTPMKAGDNSPAGLHRQAVQADHQGDKALAWLLYRRFFEAPAGDLAALRLPLAGAQQRFEVLNAELATWSADHWVNAGSRLANDGRRDEGSTCIERGLQIDPRHPGAWSSKAAGAFRRGQAALGMKSYGGGEASDPDAHFEEAVRCFDRSLAGAPDKIGSWETRGMALFFLTRPRDAAESFARARALKPPTERYLDVSEDGSAIVSIDPAHEGDEGDEAPAPAEAPAKVDAPAPADVRSAEALIAAFRHAGELEKRGHTEEAVQVLERFIAEAEEVPPALIVEAKHQLAGLLLRRARSHALPASMSLEVQALDLGRTGKMEEALVIFEQAVKADPRNAGAWSNRANALSELGRHEEALHSADTALKIAPRSADTWGNKGRALAQLGREAEALACFDKALRYDPKHAMSWYNRGVSMLRGDDLPEAIRCFEAALAIEPDHPLAHKAFARVLKELMTINP